MFTYRHGDPDTKRGPLLTQDTQHLIAFELFRIQFNDLEGEDGEL